MQKITVVKARYRNSDQGKKQGNCLISALPAKMSPSRLRQVLSRFPSFPELGVLAKDERISTVKKGVNQILMPTSPFVEFYHAVYHLIEDGYESRNPLEPSVIGWTYDIADPEINVKELRERHQLTQYDGQTTCEHMFFTGLSGMGKSLVKNSVMSVAFPNVIVHQRENFDEIQIVQLHVEMPHDGTRATLLKNFFRAFDYTLQGVEKTNYFEMVQPKLGRSATIGAMESFLQDLCIKYHVGVVFIDEFQNINVATKTDIDKMRQLFDSLSNDLLVPFVKIGTVEALKPFESKFRHGRRGGEPLELWPYVRIAESTEEALPNGSIERGSEKTLKKSDLPKRNRGKDWDNLVRALFSFQLIKQPIQYSMRWDEELYRFSCGIPYVLFTLWREAQVDAIRSGKETLTLSRLKTVYNKRFKLIKLALASLRKKKIGLFQDLLSISQLFDKGENEAALKHLKRFADEEQFSGAAAITIVEKLEEFETQSELKPNEQALLNRVRAKLELRAQPVKAGQTIEHEKS
ncbi:ATP-binding protein [Neptuniibacter sp. SY11_33]|uniref:ATP-binding protein n=1 Tax=Neptuniibacter sp. SY11_33 TaxID=3398215 RepID=UPI0039F5D45A